MAIRLVILAKTKSDQTWKDELSHYTRIKKRISELSSTCRQATMVKKSPWVSYTLLQIEAVSGRRTLLKGMVDQTFADDWCFDKFG